MQIIRHVGFISKLITCKLCFEMVPNSSADNATHVRCLDVFVENENARKVAWAVNLIKIRFRGLAISKRCWNFRKRDGLKITCDGLLQE